MNTFTPRSVAEAEYIMVHWDEMFPGWVYVFRTKDQWLPPYSTIRVIPKKHIRLGVMDVHKHYAFLWAKPTPERMGGV